MFHATRPAMEMLEIPMNIFKFRSCASFNSLLMNKFDELVKYWLLFLKNSGLTYVTPSKKKNETSVISFLDESPTKEFQDNAKRPEILFSRCN